VKDAWVDADPYAVAVLLAKPGRLDALVKGGCAKLVGLDRVVTVETPGDNGVAVRLKSKQIVDIAALGQEHQVCAGKAAEEWDQHLCKIGYMVKGEAVKHLTHVKAGGT